MHISRIHLREKKIIQQEVILNDLSPHPFQVYFIFIQYSQNVSIYSGDKDTNNNPHNVSITPKYLLFKPNSKYFPLLSH